MLAFTDIVLRKIGEDIAAHQPERGGALLGLPNSNVVTTFISDPEAEVTTASYLPSSLLTEQVQKEEQSTGTRFMGVIHSHPGNLDRPSGQDRIAFQRGLEINPSLSRFIAPIVTINMTKHLQSHEVNLEPRGKMSVYVATRIRKTTHLISREPQVKLTEQEIIVICVDRDIDLLIQELKAPNSVFIKKTYGFFEMNGTVFISATLAFESFELVILVPPTYPLSCPNIIFTRKGSSKEIAFNWSIFINTKNVLSTNCKSPIQKLINEEN